MQMRPSRVLRKLRAGEIVSCLWVGIPHGRVAEIAAMLGFDCLWTCREHGPNDLSTLEEQIRAAKIYDVDVMARVSRGSYSDYVWPLELDAAGIMVPHVMSQADAQEVIRMTRFHPLGRRSMDGGNADGSYANLEYSDYVTQANRERFVVAQIEDPEPLAELDAIASTEGLDMLFFGPFDFSQAIGAPGAWHHPRLVEARRRVAEAALAHGKSAGTIATPANMDEMLDLGYRFIAMGADVLGLSQYCKNILAEFAKRGAFEGSTEQAGGWFESEE